jgi:hypothetical protein
LVIVSFSGVLDSVLFVKEEAFDSPDPELPDTADNHPRAAPSCVGTFSFGRRGAFSYIITFCGVLGSVFSCCASFLFYPDFFISFCYRFWGLQKLPVSGQVLFCEAGAGVSVGGFGGAAAHNVAVEFV